DGDDAVHAPAVLVLELRPGSLELVGHEPLGLRHTAFRDVLRVDLLDEVPERTRHLAAVLREVSPDLCHRARLVASHRQLLWSNTHSLAVAGAPPPVGVAAGRAIPVHPLGWGHDCAFDPGLTGPPTDPAGLGRQARLPLRLLRFLGHPV